VSRRAFGVFFAFSFWPERRNVSETSVMTGLIDRKDQLEIEEDEETKNAFILIPYLAFLVCVLL
jgi:hypothetical protein